MIPIMKNEKVSLTKCSYVRLFLVQLYKDTKDTIKKTRVRLNIRLLMEGDFSSGMAAFASEAN